MVLFLTAIASLLSFFALRNVDAALRWLHAEDHSVWRSLGSPPGFLWVPSGNHWLLGATARQKFVTAFFMGRAPWMGGSKQLRQFRQAYLACFSALLLVVIAAGLSALRDETVRGSAAPAKAGWVWESGHDSV